VNFVKRQNGHVTGQLAGEPETIQRNERQSQTSVSLPNIAATPYTARDYWMSI